jgi:hypothetical protein
VAGPEEYGNKPLGYVKCREFLEQLRKYELVKKDTASQSWLAS